MDKERGQTYDEPAPDWVGKLTQTIQSADLSPPWQEFLATLVQNAVTGIKRIPNYATVPARDVRAFGNDLSIPQLLPEAYAVFSEVEQGQICYGSVGGAGHHGLKLMTGAKTNVGSPVGGRSGP